MALARHAVSHFLETGKRLEYPKGKFGKRGVFVTIETFPEKELRGCIGFPYPVLELEHAVVDAALSAAFRDPRFPPVRREELGKVVFEMSVLSIPKEIEGAAAERHKKVRVGRDGLTIERGGAGGLLLPQVAAEHNWEAEEFLKHVCFKAGLAQDAWLDQTSKVCVFRAQIFSETTPNGKVAGRKA